MLLIIKFIILLLLNKLKVSIGGVSGEVNFSSVWSRRAGGAILPLLLTAALAIYCFYISLAGKPLLAEATLQEEVA